MEDIAQQPWQMTCPGCQNACILTVHGNTSKTLQRVRGSHCGAGFTYARRVLQQQEKENQSIRLEKTDIQEG